MKLIVGLGNPGKEYEKTRHNVGFRVLEGLRKSWNMSEKFHTLLCEDLEGVILMKPQTFMNLSGKAVGAFVSFYKINPTKDLLVVSDDKDMVFGKLRLRKEGSSGGHKGLQSIIEALGTDEFHRLKIGVGHDDQKMPTDAFVLQKFTKEEEKKLPEILESAASSIHRWILER